MEPSEVTKKLQEKEQQQAPDVQRATRGCEHRMGVRATLYKGVVPMHVTYCEECGALGPANAEPTLGEWVAPRVQRNR